MGLNEFVDANYDILYGNINEADEFLLVDAPDSVGHREINSQFINTFATPNDMVLIQAIPSMKEIKAVEASQSSWLKTTAKIVGWDRGTVEEIQKLPVCVQSEKDTIKINLILMQLRESTEDNEELNEKLKKAIRNNFELIGELFSHEKEIADNEAQTFPTSVESMKNSLIEAKKQSKRTFLIAKSLYLVPEEENDDARLSNKELEQFIQTRKVVILLPKKVLVEELNKKHKNFFRTLFQGKPKT